jgi:hypothetical protein
MQPCRFNSQHSNQNPGLSDGFLASLAELANCDGISNALRACGLGGGGGAFDWPTGLSSSPNAQRSGTTTLNEFVSLPYVLTYLLT